MCCRRKGASKKKDTNKKYIIFKNYTKRWGRKRHIGTKGKEKVEQKC